jgi:predicted small lipoprotein YifL
VKRVPLFAAASLLSCLLSALAGCGQTGPLYMPTPAQRGIAPPSPPTMPAAGATPPSGMVRSQDEAQVQQPTPGVIEPRPGNR